MKMAHLATRIARGLGDYDWSPDAVRDACDEATGSELAPRALDRLTEMVERRLSRPDFYGLWQ